MGNKKQMDLMDLIAGFREERRIHVQIVKVNDESGAMIDDYFKSALVVTNKNGRDIMTALVGEFNDEELAAMFASSLLIMDKIFEARPQLRDLVKEKMDGRDLRITGEEGNLESLREW